MKTRSSVTRRLNGVYLRGKIFWYRYSHLGQQYRASLETSDEPEAIAKAMEMRENPQLAGSGTLQREIKIFLSLLPTIRNPHRAIVKRPRHFCRSKKPHLLHLAQSDSIQLVQARPGNSPDLSPRLRAGSLSHEANETFFTTFNTRKPGEGERLLIPLPTPSSRGEEETTPSFCQWLHLEVGRRSLRRFVSACPRTRGRNGSGKSRIL